MQCQENTILVMYWKSGMKSQKMTKLLMSHLQIDDDDGDDDYTPDEPCSGIDALAKNQTQDGDEIDSCGTQDCSNATTTATRMPNKKTGGKRASSIKHPKER